MLRESVQQHRPPPAGAISKERQRRVSPGVLLCPERGHVPGPLLMAVPAAVSTVDPMRRPLSNMVILLTASLVFAACSGTDSPDSGDETFDDFAEVDTAMLEAIDAVTAIARRIASTGAVTDDVLDAAVAVATEEDIDPYMLVSAFHPGSDEGDDAVFLVGAADTTTFGEGLADQESGNESGKVRCISPRGGVLENVECPAAVVALAFGSWWQGEFPAEGPYTEISLESLPTLGNAAWGIARAANELGRISPTDLLDADDLRTAAANAALPDGFTASFDETSGIVTVGRTGSPVAVCVAVSEDTSRVSFEGESWSSTYALVSLCPQ